MKDIFYRIGNGKERKRNRKVCCVFLFGFVLSYSPKLRHAPPPRPPSYYDFHYDYPASPQPLSFYQLLGLERFGGVGDATPTGGGSLCAGWAGFTPA